MPDVFSIGITGLNAAKTALDAIANNVANVNTPGYARQSAQVNSQAATKVGNGYVGNGVTISGIVALVSPYLENQVTRATGSAANSSQSATYYNQLQAILSDSASGVSANVASFQTALGQVANSPNSIPARQLVLSNAKALASSINSAATLLQEQKQGAVNTLGSDVKGANSLIKQIATLNDTITRSEARDANGVVLPGSLANDLRSQRQNLINQLSTYATVSTNEQNEGVTVTLAGTAVVVSNRASTLSLQSDPTDPTRQTVGIATPAGQVPLDPATIGGKVGATLEFVTNGVQQGLAQLNQYAGVLAQTINDQSAKGVDLYGAAGTALLSTTPPSVAASSLNTGTLTLSTNIDPYQSQASDYKLSYSTAGGYVLTRLSDNTSVVTGSSLPLTADGLTIASASGAVANGDSYVIKPFGNQAGSISVKSTDPRQLALSNPVASSANQANASTASIAAPKVVSALPLDPNLTSAVSIVFTSATQYTISGAGIGTLSNQTYTPGAAISYNGWSTSINGAPKTGDSFAIGASTGAIGDGSNANALSGLLQSKIYGGGTQSLADLYASIQSDVGNKAALAQTNATSDASVLTIAQNQRESYSGVNLDEEAADLVRWQQIYSANAQVLSVAQKLFDELLNKFG